MATLNRYAIGWSDPMGSFAGAPNMITGKTEPMEKEQPYDEWLMEMLIEHGVGSPFSHIPYSKEMAARGIGHIESKETMAMSGASVEHRLTPKAQRYLDIMNKENEL
jgi:hypothetical protein